MDEIRIKALEEYTKCITGHADNAFTFPLYQQRIKLLFTNYTNFYYT